MIHFAAYTAADTSSAFHWGGQPSKMSLPVGRDILKCLKHGSLGQRESVLKRHLDQSSRLAQLHIRVINT